jgi:hypothetical protein
MATQRKKNLGKRFPHGRFVRYGRGRPRFITIVKDREDACTSSGMRGPPDSHGRRRQPQNVAPRLSSLAPPAVRSTTSDLRRREPPDQ